MNVFWLTPSAWWGLAALAVPIAIHLLTRQQTRRIPFPTLRFLSPTRLAALRRRSIHEWPLLIVRVLILAAAVAALAGPLFVSAARQAEWQTRVARAFVVAPSPAADAAARNILTEESQGSFASAVFRPEAYLADGVRDAVDWLDRQPPAARELVVTGDLKEGAIAEPDLGLVPAAIGLRFLPQPIVSSANSSVGYSFGRIALFADRTEVTYRDAAELTTEAISIRSAPADEPFARAARDAVIRRGIRRDRAAARRVLVLFDGADTSGIQLTRPADSQWMRDALAQLPGMSGGQMRDMLVVRVPARANNLEAAHAIDRIVRATFAEDLRGLEPRAIPAATLARWSRPPRPDLTVPVSDEGDRRWFWGLALALIAVETIVRRSRPAVADSPPIQEQRVA